MSRFISRIVCRLMAMFLLAGSIAMATPDAPSAERSLLSGAEPSKKHSLPADGRANAPSLSASRGAKGPRSLPTNGKVEPPLRWDRLEPSVIERNTKRLRVEKPAFPAERL